MALPRYGSRHSGSISFRLNAYLLQLRGHYDGITLISSDAQLRNFDHLFLGIHLLATCKFSTAVAVNLCLSAMYLTNVLCSCIRLKILDKLYEFVDTSEVFYNDGVKHQNTFLTCHETVAK